MSILADFLRVLHKFMSSSLLLVLTPAGLFVTVISSVSVAVGGMFSRFTFFTPAVTAIQNATTSVQTIMNAPHGALGDVFLGFFAIDRIVQTILLLITLTIGVSTVALITIFCSSLRLCL